MNIRSHKQSHCHEATLILGVTFFGKGPFRDSTKFEEIDFKENR